MAEHLGVAADVHVDRLRIRTPIDRFGLEADCSFVFRLRLEGNH